MIKIIDQKLIKIDKIADSLIFAAFYSVQKFIASGFFKRNYTKNVCFVFSNLKIIQENYFD